MKKGFSEIELFLFFILIAFITLGVKACQGYVDNAKIKADIVDITKYKNAIGQFKQKYAQLPGDFTKAKQTFQNCPEIADQKISCNGNGDGFWDNNEPLYVFYQLSEAGFIGGSYNISATDSKLYPKLSSTEQSIVPVGALPANAQAPLSHIFYNYKLPANSLMVYFESDNVGASMPPQRRIENNIVQTIDQKLDDGAAATGDVRAAFDDANIFGPYKTYELCTDKNGRYKAADDDATYCSFIIKY